MSACRGFTLIELLVAISLATIITVLGVSLMRISINSSVGGEEALKQSQAVRDTRRLIEYAWVGRRSTGFGGRNDRIEFVSSQPSTGSLPLRFACQAGEENQYALWLYKVAPPAEQADEAAETLSGELLLAGLGACKFGLLQAPADDKQPAQWKEDWPPGQEPPTVIRLDLATRQGALPPLIFSAGGP